MQGWVPQMILRGKEGEAEKAMGQMIDIFGKEIISSNFSNHGIEEQAQLVPRASKVLAKKFDVKVVASNDVHYVKETIGPHDALLCIQTGSKLDDPNRMLTKPANFI